MRSSNGRQILLILDLRYKSGREQLTGFYRFADHRPEWSVQLIPGIDAFYVPLIERSLGQGVDGAVVRGEIDLSLAQKLHNARIPTVVIDPPISQALARHAKAFVFADNTAIGRTAAAHFDELGVFASYGYVPPLEVIGSDWAKETRWAKEREAGFFAAVEARHGAAPRTTADRALLDWLRSLPRPAAVFAAFDGCAAAVVDACHQLKLRIPRDISLLGVDDDELICDHTRPTLSSIRPDHVRQGEVAAQELHRILRGKSPASRSTKVCPPLGVTVRDSTKHIPPAQHLIRKANEFLDEHAFDPIRVEDIVRHLGVSSRLALLRYSEATGHSLREELVRRRLARAQHLLGTTGLPVSRIATRCGFSSSVVLGHIFRKRCGLTPRAWRERQ